MAGYAAALTTVDAVRQELSIGSGNSDVYLQNLINAVSDQIARACNRDFTYSSSWVESIPGYGATRLFLSHAPVVSIASITYRDGVLPVANYLVENAECGFVYGNPGFLWTTASIPTIIADRMPGTENPLYVITYAGGYVTPQQSIDLGIPRTLPYDLEYAAIDATVARYRSRGYDPRIKSETLMDYSVDYGSSDMMASMAAVLNAYRRVAIA